MKAGERSKVINNIVAGIGDITGRGGEVGEV
jgi:hypothetical protein